MTVEELIERLRPAFDLRSTERYVVSASVHPAFVSPPLEEVEPIGSSRTVLISAPAAVGKTTLANYLAAKSGALLWDLSRMRLGDAVLIGSLGRAYGYDKLGELVPQLAKAQVSLVLDGLDEAYVRSGVDGLEALASDVHEILYDAAPQNSGVTFVVLGRSTAIELFALALDDAGVTSSRLGIGFFDPVAAKQLVDSQAGSGVEKRSYVETRDRLLTAIRESIGSEEDDGESSFLGYAPVLNAIGRYLAEPEEVASALDRQAAQGGAFWDQLVRVGDEILARETRKVWAQIEDPEKLSKEFYSPAHQMEMLLAARPKLLVDAGWTAADEAARRQAVEAATTALETHPFVASDRLDEPFMRRFVNTVFRDFLVAEALRGDDLDLFITITDVFWAGEYAPSSLAAFFYLRPDADGVAATSVDPELLSLLQASLAAEMLSHDEPVSLVMTCEGRELAVTVGRRGISQTLDFRASVGEAITLSTPLSHTSATLADLSVRLRPIGEELALGPQLSLRASSIDIEGDRIWVDANGGEPVLLSSEEVNILAAHLEVRVSRENGFAVQVPHPPYPLRRFAIAGPETISEEELLPPLLDLRRLLAWFEAGPSRQVAYFKKPLDTAARKGRVSGAMLDFALSSGLLRESGKLYLAEPDVVEIDLFRVRRGELDESIKEFLRSFVDWRRSREL